MLGRKKEIVWYGFMPDYEGALWFISQFAQLWESNPEATCLGSILLILLITKIPWLRLTKRAMFWKKMNTNIQDEVKGGVVNINDPQNVNFTQNVYGATPASGEEDHDGE